MMKKTIFTLCVICLAAGASFGSSFTLEINGGFTTLGMQDLNRQMITDFTANTLNTQESHAPVDAGFEAGMVLNYDILSWLLLGLKTGYLASNRAEFSYTQVMPMPTPFGDQTTEAKRKLDASCVPLLIGASAGYDFKPAPFSASAFIRGGCVFGYIHTDENSKIVMSAIPDMPFISTVETIFFGASFAMEFGAKAEYKISDNLSISSDFSYRMARIDKFVNNMNNYSYNPQNHPGKGGTLLDIYGRNVRADFSGITVRGGIAWTFR